MKEKPSNLKKILPICILLATILMGIGYAAINSIVVEVGGKAYSKEVDGVYITDAKYLNNVDADLTDSKINNAYQTNLNTSVELSSTNPNSSITYQITVYNSTNSDYSFKEPAYMLGDITYDNQNITFSIAGIEKKDVIKSKQSKTFQITFYYLNNVVSTNNSLNCIINFVFEPIKQLVRAGTVINVGNNSAGVFGSDLYKYNLESIHFVDHKNVPAGAKSWDASAEMNQSVIGWYIDSNGNNLYELYLGADTGRISLPADSSYMFASCSSVTYIDFSNVDTSLVVNMNYMFYYMSGIKSLDLSEFDTSNVTSMNGMFYYSMGLTDLNVTSFNTSNVTNMNNMFYYLYYIEELDLSSFDMSNVKSMNYWLAYCYKLKSLKLNNASFGSATQYSLSFYQLPSSIYVVAKDDDSRNWIQTQLGSGKGTIVTVAELG